MVQTSASRKVTFAPAGERRRLQQLRLAQQRAELVEVRRRAADSVAAADAKLDAVDREIAFVLAASLPSATGTSNRNADAKGTGSAQSAPVRRGPGRPTNASKGITSTNASAPAAGSTSHTILAILAKRPKRTFSPSEIRDATGINTALVMKTLQRMHTRGQVVRIDKGSYQVASKK
ncbi:MAG: hypothetical protein ABI949_04230 [Ilumatobacteraceae bacterium]